MEAALTEAFFLLRQQKHPARMHMAKEYLGGFPMELDQVKVVLVRLIVDFELVTFLAAFSFFILSIYTE